MTRKNTFVAGGLLALLLVLVLAVQALGFTGFKNAGGSKGGAIQTGTNLPAAAAQNSSQSFTSDASNGAASAPTYATNGAGVGQSAIANPYNGGGPFQPGYPPFGYSNPGISGDGLSAWGVAYQKTTDQSAKPGADLIKAAYQDARKQADTLASATGLSLGKVLAISDFTLNQPYYTPCVQPLPAQGVPGASLQGQSGSAGAPTSTPVKPGIPFPGPQCNADHYLVAWVMVRFAI
jgi:hypothetical protein